MQIIPFNYESKEVRVIQDDNGKPWWVASDVCEVLGLSNTTEALKGLDEDEKSTLRISEGGPEHNIINEPGLYSLIIRSNKPEAKKFKRWYNSNKKKYYLVNYKASKTIKYDQAYVEVEWFQFVPVEELAEFVLSL